MDHLSNPFRQGDSGDECDCQVCLCRRYSRRTPPPDSGLGEPRKAFGETFSGENVLLEAFGFKPDWLSEFPYLKDKLERDVDVKDLASVLNELMDASTLRSSIDGACTRIARDAAACSLDPSMKCGALVIDADGNLVFDSVACNAFPRGIADDARWHNRAAKYDTVIHAEVNAIIAAGQRAKGGTLYCWPGSPCRECAKLVIESGIERVVSPNSSSKRWADRVKAGYDLLREAGVQVDFVDIGDAPEQGRGPIDTAQGVKSSAVVEVVIDASQINSDSAQFDAIIEDLLNRLKLSGKPPARRVVDAGEPEPVTSKVEWCVAARDTLQAAAYVINHRQYMTRTGVKIMTFGDNLDGWQFGRTVALVPDGEVTASERVWLERLETNSELFHFVMPEERD
jgi:dCMP deaminase